ncbi:MAG: hypothetical protein KDC38_17095, partial [Planctomycetes bacterium]|nr:hypothetical protein [Planctomycetota bacterium]
MVQRFVRPIHPTAWTTGRIAGALRAGVVLTLAWTVPTLGNDAELSAMASKGSVDLDYRIYRDWSIELPAERFDKVGDGFAIPFSQADKYVARLEGTALGVDTDGDGEVDVRAEGEKGLVALRGQTDSGRPFKYALRLDSSRGWRYTVSGAMVGRIGATKIQLIDQNNNGRYDDFGEDAMVVGRGRSASFLSHVIRVDDQLYAIDVSPDGSRVDYRPFDGPVGRLDVISKLDTKAKLAVLVIRSLDGRHSFELSGEKGAVEVPAGTYALHSGKLALGPTRVSVRAGRSKSFRVSADETRSLAWGGPLRIEYQYQKE